jgi:UDP-N-acetylmuramoyl-tripeptide--D-alanyl-D-alanine ligase
MSAANSSLENSAPFSLQDMHDATPGSLFVRGDIILNGEVVPSKEFEYSMIKGRGVTTDTRKIAPGSIFVALRGERFDGHDFLEQAQQAGAAFVVVEDVENAPENLVCFYALDSLMALGDMATFHRNRFDIPVIGVTGSYGKTTTRAFIAAALSPLGEILASRENFNNEIGVPQTLFGLNASHKAAVVEMGMRGEGQILYLANMARPTIGVITNVGPQHIELLGNLENIARAKAELIENLAPDSLAVLPSEGEYSELLIEIAREVGCRVVTFGTSEQADFRVSSTRTTENGSFEAQFKIQNSEFEIALPLPGAHNATNAAAALAVAHELGVDLEKAARALETVEVPGARMRVVRAGEITILDDSYNAGPDSMRAALETLRDLPNAKRRVAVLGAMKELGDFSEEEHRKLGVLASTICDVVVYVGEETRAAFEVTTIETLQCENASEAANRVLDLVESGVESGDVVLVKGSRSVGLELVVSALAQ